MAQKNKSRNPRLLQSRGSSMVVIGYILAVLEPFPLGLIFGLILYFLTDNTYYQHHAKYMIIISVILTVIVLVFFGGMIFTMLGVGLLSSKATTVLI